jgi:YegS/Rv2252/BmrU family lipid kinase
VLVVGGDGTINEAANGLAGTEVALGVLPMGTGNVWAAQIGLVPVPTPLHRPRLLSAARALAEGEMRRVDLGRAGTRYFLLWAGVGLDALVTRAVETEAAPIKRRLGPFAYGVAGLRVVWSYAGTRAVVSLDGRELKARVLLVLISNVQLYAGMVRPAARARIDDGWLDVCVFKGRGMWATARHLATVTAGQHLHDTEMIYRRARRVSLRLADPLPVQVDGEPVDPAPLEFSVVPAALTVLVPPNVPQALFTEPEGRV